MRRHKDLGEVHIRGKAECEYRQDADPAEARSNAHRRSTRLPGCTTSRMSVPSAKRSRDHACRQRKHQTAVAQKRGAHSTQREQQPIVARKKDGLGLARTLGIGIATGQAAGNELNGLHQ